MAKAAMKTTVKPLGDNLLIQRVDAESTTAGGIVLPESAQEKPKQGTIIALGAGKALDDGSRSEFTVAKGDKVLFSSYAGTELKLDGQDYLLISESDVLAVIE